MTAIQSDSSTADKRKEREEGRGKESGFE